MVISALNFLLPFLCLLYYIPAAIRSLHKPWKSHQYDCQSFMRDGCDRFLLPRKLSFHIFHRTGHKFLFLLRHRQAFISSGVSTPPVGLAEFNIMSLVLEVILVSTHLRQLKSFSSLYQQEQVQPANRSGSHKWGVPDWDK